MKTRLSAFPQWLAELFTRCPREPDGRWRDRDVLIVAHRGQACDMPENTIPSFESAIDRARCSAIELDVCFTRDGEVVVWHDWDPSDAIALARQSGLEEAVKCRPVVPNIGSPWRRPVPELDLDDLRRHYGYGVKTLLSSRIDAEIPTLDEFFAWAVGRSELTHVMLDFKIPEDGTQFVDPMLARIDELVAKHQPRFRIIYSTPCMPVLEAMEQRAFHPNYAFDVEPPFGFVLRPKRFSSVRVAIRFENAFATSVHPKITTVAPWTTYRRVVRADVKAREKHNRRNPSVPIERVLAATINERDLIRCLLAIGVDGLITDCPDIVREEAERAGRRVR